MRFKTRPTLPRQIPFLEKFVFPVRHAFQRNMSTRIPCKHRLIQIAITSDK